MEGVLPGQGDCWFLVVNFPYQVAEDQMIPELDQSTKTFLCAKPAGTYTYTTVAGASRTIWKLDYGHIYVPPPPAPPTPEQIAAEQKKRKQTEASTIKWLQDQADQGEAYAQRRLGERYMKGDGVETNLVKAKELLTKAAAQGDQDATDMLTKLQ